MTSQETVFENANKAYKTAGLSANEYMETVTSFSASLLQSLGGDTEKAAQYANLAIVDMSDNANKMGTSMESIQYAYQGFAKQNYTMLDNLKLGYGGTKEEMQRLLDEAGKLAHTKFDISSYADVVTAIHIIQQEMGITGTTAKEASTTIQGSLASMKSAWENLVTGVADSNQDLSALVDTFVDSVSVAGRNLLPRIKEALHGVVQLINELAPMIIEELPGFVSELLPDVLEAARNIFTAAIRTFPEVISTLVDIISEHADELIESGKSIINSLIEGAKKVIPQLIDAVSGAITQIGDDLAKKFPQLSGLFENLLPIVEGITVAFIALKAAMAIGSIVSGIGSAFAALSNPITLVVVAIAGITGAIKTLWDNNEDFRKAVIKIWGKIKTTFTETWDDIKEAWEKVGPFFSDLWDGIKETFTKTWDNLKQGWDNTKTALNNTWQTIKTNATDKWEKIKNTVNEANENVRTKISTAWDKVSSNLRDIWDRIKSNASYDWQEITNTIHNIFNDLPNKIRTIGGNILSGLWEGIREKWDWLRGKVSGAIDTVKDWFTGKDGFDTHSPSKWAYDIGEYVDEGLANGISENAESVRKVAEDLAESVYDSVAKWADNQVDLYDATLQEQLELWQAIQKQFVENSEQYLEAESKIYDIKKQIYKEYLDNVDEIYKKADELEQKYQDAVEQRTKEIYGYYGLFAEVPKEEAVDGQKLVDNLHDQIIRVDSFYKGLDKLTERGVGQRLVEEIREMGPDVYEELQAILNLSDEQLENYATLYEIKQQQANAWAVDGLEQLREDTNIEIEQLLNEVEDLYEENTPIISDVFVGGMSDNILAGLDDVVASATEVAQSAVDAIEDTFNTFNSTFDPFANAAWVTSGAEIMQGFSDAYRYGGNPYIYGGGTPGGFLSGWQNNFGTGRGVNITQNIYSQAKTAADLMEEARWNFDMAVAY